MQMNTCLYFPRICVTKTLNNSKLVLKTLKLLERSRKFKYPGKKNLACTSLSYFHENWESCAGGHFARFLLWSCGRNTSESPPGSAADGGSHPGTEPSCFGRGAADEHQQLLWGRFSLNESWVQVTLRSKIETHKCGYLGQIFLW